MTYNIHPLFVHFPIAFLLLYSLLKVLPFYKWFPAASWKYTRLVILIAGVLGAFLASSTGEIAEGIVQVNHNVVETHAVFASVSTWIYGVLLAGEILVIANPFFTKKITSQNLLRFYIFIQKILTNNFLSITLAIVGVITISLTGLLGGAMVYGTTADPFAPFVFRLLGL